MCCMRNMYWRMPQRSNQRRREVFNRPQRLRWLRHLCRCLPQRSNQSRRVITAQNNTKRGIFERKLPRFFSLLFFKHLETQKIQGTYFKISALYFKIYGLYFSQQATCVFRCPKTAFFHEALWCDTTVQKVRIPVKNAHTGFHTWHRLQKIITFAHI